MGSGRKLALLSEEVVRLVASSSVARCLHASLKSLMVRAVKVVFVTTSFLVTTCSFTHDASNARVFTDGHFWRAYVSWISTLRGKSCYLQAPCCQYETMGVEHRGTDRARKVKIFLKFSDVEVCTKGWVEIWEILEFKDCAFRRAR